MARTVCYEFLRDVRGTIFGNANRKLGRVVKVALIADMMKMSVEKANRYLWFAEKYGLTKRRAGGWII